MTRWPTRALTGAITILMAAGCSTGPASPARELDAIPAAAVADRAAPEGERDAPPPAGVVWDVAAGEEIAPETLRDRLGAADLVILGEVHDNPVHHARQAWLIAGLDPVGVAFEMVPEGSERGIAVFREGGGRAAEIGPAIGWSRLGWPDWEIYRPVFEASANAVIAGGGQGRRQVTRAMREGAAEVFGPRAGAAGLDEPLPAAQQQALEAMMVAAHCDMLPAEMAGPMVEAQRLRDAAFAEALLRARSEGIVARGTGAGMNDAERPERAADTPMRAVLVTGNGHARRDHGVPRYLAELAPALDVAVLGQVESAAGRADPADYAGDLPYDYVWFSGGVEGRPDPCAAFGQR